MIGKFGKEDNVGDEPPNVAGPYKRCGECSGRKTVCVDQCPTKGEEYNAHGYPLPLEEAN